MEPEGKPDKRFSGYMIGYSTEAELMVNTTDPEKILERCADETGGGAALYDAVYQACTSRTLVKGERSNRGAIVTSATVTTTPARRI